MTIITPEDVYEKYRTRLNNVELIMKDNMKCIDTKELKFTGNKDYPAHTVPILVNITQKNMDNIIESKGNSRKKLIWKLTKETISDVNDIYDYSNLIYNTVPKTDNSYKKHILNVLPLVQKKLKGGVLDINWNKKKYTDYYHSKCWWVYIDNRKNRIIIIRWNGTRLLNSLA